MAAFQRSLLLKTQFLSASAEDVLNRRAAHQF
jgi:hypothetical protein